MSLLADLLSKIKQPQAKREVPPNLQNIVQSSAMKSGRNKIVLLSIILIIFIGAGIGVILFVNSLNQSSSDTAVLTRPDITDRLKRRGNISPTQPSDPAQAVPAPDTMTTSAEAVRVKATPSDKKEFVQSASLPIAESIIESPKEAKDQSVPSPLIQAELSSDYNHDALLYSAREHEVNNEYTKALADYKKVLQSDSNNITLINTIAFIYLKLGKIDESIEHTQRALAIDGNHTPSLINMGIAYARDERMSEAEVYFNKALVLEPHNQMSLLNLAILNERKSDYAAASAHYTELMKLGDLEGLLGLARIHDTQGMKDRAVEYYRRAYTHDAADDKTKVRVRQRIMLLMNREGGA